MTVPAAPPAAALLPVLLLAALAMAHGGRAAGAEAIGAAQVIDLVTAARHIHYGSPQVVTLAIAGRSVACTVSVSTLGAITAVPVAADRAVRQISIAVTTTNDGVVPDAVTVITGAGEVLGFTVTRGADGAVVGLAEGAPVSVPPPRSALVSGLGVQALSVWLQGEGSIGAAPAARGALIGAFMPAAATAKAPARLLLLTAPNSVVTLGPGAEVSLATEKDAAGTHLIIALDRGAIEVSLGNKGGYRDVLVRGAAMQARVTGTLFAIERVARDADYLALVAGHLMVGLRPEVAAALGKPGAEVDLAPHQGIAASVAGGLGQVEPLSSRPAVSDAVHPIHDQATSAHGGFGAEGPEILAPGAATGAASAANAGGAGN